MPYRRQIQYAQASPLQKCPAIICQAIVCSKFPDGSIEDLHDLVMRARCPSADEKVVLWGDNIGALFKWTKGAM
jgi:hypothetical protein